VLDVFDKCSADDRAELVALLDALARSAARPVKLFISSCLDCDIHERFIGGLNVAVGASDNSGDIARFVAAKMDKRQQWARRLPDALRDEIIETLREKSHGMYVVLWPMLLLSQSLVFSFWLIVILPFLTSSVF
jgi:hypothetical protein